MYWVVSFYHFFSVKDPKSEVLEHHKFFNDKDYRGRIYIDSDGINAQFSAPPVLVKEYLSWLQNRHNLESIEVKINEDREHAFYKMKVKARPLVAFGEKVDLSQRGEHLSASDWKKKMMEEEQNRIIIDARNGYESKVGHFEGALLPECDTFKEFVPFSDKIAETHDPENTEVMMYCTGGIRCEYLSAYFKKKGFKKVYQLDGGVIRYGEKEGMDHWKGSLFVFDDRLTVPIANDNSEIISQCEHCSKSCDRYINCANMDCNELFLCCPECAKIWEGCCSKECQIEPRKRAFESSEHPKPFRRLPKEVKKQFCSCLN
jgi:UPF0176 protein